MLLVTKTNTRITIVNEKNQKTFRKHILSTAVRDLKPFRSRRTWLGSKIKKFFWRYKWHVYQIKFLQKEIPRLGFITKTLQASLMFKWKKTFFRKRRSRRFFRRRRIRTKHIVRSAFRSKKKRGKKGFRQFIRNLVYNFKRMFSLAKKFLLKKINILQNYVAPLQAIKKRFKNSAEFSLVNRTHLTLRVLKRKFINFLYKKPKFVLLKLLKTAELKKKKKRKKLTLVNLHKKYAWKLRCARYVHWDLRTLGKLNEWRYQKLLGVEVRALHTTRRSQFLNYIFVRCFCLTISWKSLKGVLPHIPLVYNGQTFFGEDIVNKGDIAELPGGAPFKVIRKLYFKYFRRLVGRVKKLSYRSYLIRSKKRKHAKIYTHVPKAFKKLPIGLKRFGRVIAHELLLNAIAIIKSLSKLSHDLSAKISLSSVIALQTWRYRFD